MRKPTKTISGVTPLAVVLKPAKCKHGTCLFCPTLEVPQSYTPLSPAIMRAHEVKYDAFKQVKSRLKAFKIMGHPTDKIELIVLGGTFLDYPTAYQKKFILECYNALNNKKSRTIKEAKKLNEKAKHRCIALCIETRPDSCSKKDIKRMLDFGATRVEIGVQAVDDKIYKTVKRGHTVRDVVQATQFLKDAGFKLGYHMMPGLPGSNFKRDIAMFHELFSDQKFKPDQIKIYPTQVIAGSELVKLYNEGKYNPYSDKELTELLIQIKRDVPRYVRIMRVMREIPPDYTVAGTHRIDLRKVVAEEMHKRGLKCNCIRCREIGFAMRERKQIADEKQRKDIFNLYLKNAKLNKINNWDLVDCSADKIIGEYLQNEDIVILKKLANSKNLWEKRIAMISTFQFIKKGKHKECLEIADILVYDSHDLIHKAVGWMLRELGKRVSQEKEEEFLKKYYKTMPRTMLRYAIERFDDKKKNFYMGR